jgi:hypothetical protein
MLEHAQLQRRQLRQEMLYAFLQVVGRNPKLKVQSAKEIPIYKLQNPNFKQATPLADRHCHWSFQAGASFEL